MTRLLLCCALALSPVHPVLGQAPLVDYHQHLVALLDSAGIRRALVLSVAYTFGNPSRQVEVGGLPGAPVE